MHSRIASLKWVALRVPFAGKDAETNSLSKLSHAVVRTLAFKKKKDI